jgi:hypothetical protein
MSGISLVFDISFFAEGMLNSSTADKAKFSRAGRAARLGTNVARVVKLGKLCSLGWLKRYFHNDNLEKARQARQEDKVREQLKKVQEINKSPHCIGIVGNSWNIYSNYNKDVEIDPSVLRRIRRKDISKQICNKEWFEFGNSIDAGMFNSEGLLNADIGEDYEEESEEKVLKHSKLAAKLSYLNTKRMIMCC